MAEITKEIVEDKLNEAASKFIDKTRDTIPQICEALLAVLWQA